MTEEEKKYEGCPCFVCKHYEGDLKCKAFPDVIPLPYLTSRAFYDEPHGTGYKFELDPPRMTDYGHPVFIAD